MFNSLRLVLVLAALSAASLLPLGTGRAEDIYITVGGPDGSKTLAPELFGFNVQWTDRGDGLMAGPDTASLIRDIKDFLAPTIIRYPGGLLAGKYDWRAGVAARRGQSADYASPAPNEEVAFGSGEYLKLLSGLGARGLITVKTKKLPGKTDPAPADAAAWFRWFAEHNPDPSRITLPWWEVGNESYVPADPSHVGPAAKYAAVFREIRAALKDAAREKNLEVRVGAVLEANLLGVPWLRIAMPDTIRWNETVIGGLKGEADFFIIHLYGPFDLAGLSDDEARRLILASPERLGHNIDTIREAVGDTPLMVTEFNYSVGDSRQAWQYGEDPIQGAYVAGMFIEFARRGLAGACYWSLIGNHNFGLVKDARSRTLRPAGALYANLRPLRGARVLTTRYAVGETGAGEAGTGRAEAEPPATFTVSGLTPLQTRPMGVMALAPGDPWLRENPTLRPLAALGLEKDGKRYLLVVNRSTTETAAVTCRGAAMLHVQNPLAGPARLEPGARPAAWAPVPAEGVTVPPAEARLIAYE